MRKTITKTITEWMTAVIVIAAILILLVFGGVFITAAMVLGCAAFVVALVYDIGLGLLSVLRRGVKRLGRRTRRGV